MPSTLKTLVVLGAFAFGCGGNGGSASDGGSDGGDGGIVCETPTLAQCQDATWLETDSCGKAAREAMRTDKQATCNQLLAQHTQEVTKDIPAEDAVLPPELDGGVGKVVPVANPEQGLTTISMPVTQAGNVQQTAADATEQGLSAADQALRAQWNANGNRVASCREYVYERYYDYALFEDAVAAHYSEPMYIYDRLYGPATDPTALGTRGIAGGIIKMKEGSASPVQGPQKEYLVDISPDTECYQRWGKVFIDNVFAAMPKELLKAGEWEQYGLHDWRCGRFDIDWGGTWMPPLLVDRWQWHKTAREALAAKGIPLVKAEAMYPAVRDFSKGLVAYRAAMTAAKPDAETIKSRGSRLRELFDKAIAAGCLEKGTTACSWSPSYLIDLLRADLENMHLTSTWMMGMSANFLMAFTPAMEKDYQTCIDLTHEDFAALNGYVFKMPDGLPWPEPVSCSNRASFWVSCTTCANAGDWHTCPSDDYAASVTAVDRFAQRSTAYGYAIRDYWRDMLAAMPKDLYDINGRLRLPGVGNEVHEAHEAGGKLFGVYYGYQLSYGLPVLKGTTPTLGQICNADPAVLGWFGAGGWAFGTSKQPFIDARIEGGVNRLVDAHVDILGQRLWHPADIALLVAGPQYSIAKNIVETPRFRFSVAGWPMSMDAGIGGELGIASEYATTTHTYADNVPTQECWSLAYTFKPSVSLDAWGHLNALDIEVARAGVEVSLAMIELTLPVTVKLHQYIDTSKLKLSVDTDGALEAATLSGKVAAFILIDFGFFDVTYRYNLFKWGGIHNSLPLWATTYDVSVTDLMTLIGQGH